MDGLGKYARSRSWRSGVPVGLAGRAVERLEPSDRSERLEQSGWLKWSERLGEVHPQILILVREQKIFGLMSRPIRFHDLS